MTSNPGVIVTTRFSPQILDQLNTLAEEKYNDNTSEAVRDAVKVLLMFHQFRDKLSSPKEQSEFIKHLESSMNENQIFEYFESLDERKLQAIQQATQMTLEGKWNQKTLL